jgi:small redox-active disulfide protein 2
MTSIKILGTGCAKCERLYQEAVKAVEQTGVQAEVVKVQDLPQIMEYGVAFTPGLVIDEQVKSSGRVVRAGEIARMLEALKG